MDPEKDPSKDAHGGRSDDESGGNDRSGGASGGPAKPPPWQVPKPELHPELLTPGTPGQESPGKPKAGKPRKGTAGAQKQGPGGQGPGNQNQTGFPQPSPVFDPFARDRERDAAARKKRSQRRTVVVGLGVTALLAGTITAIVASNEQDPDYAQVCFNEETGERVEDTQCNSSAGRGGALYAWYFYSRGASVPGIGQNRTAYPNFTRTVPQGAKTSTGYSSKGGTVSRGGFGSSSKGGSTGG
ncbi:Tat pathway signal protein [Arthrobacter globiformis]|uniref:Tat pathway signal protein n=1 Tax=Arthrobacter globiformis TaxID=1665 RepID=A0A328HBK0_ARTGO|nr:Tat pathway signal protein [Arthrobacter globiformis]RAM35957.1 Tat pathway signal protein [Arthrobacter globiformis]